MSELFEVRARYDFANWPELDKAAHNAVGRVSDFAGAGAGTRDLGWVCRTEMEAHRILKALKGIGINAEAKPSPLTYEERGE